MGLFSGNDESKEPEREEIITCKNCGRKIKDEEETYSCYECNREPFCDNCLYDVGLYRDVCSKCRTKGTYRIIAVGPERSEYILKAELSINDVDKEMEKIVKRIRGGEQILDIDDGKLLLTHSIIILKKKWRMEYDE